MHQVSSVMFCVESSSLRLPSYSINSCQCVRNGPTVLVGMVGTEGLRPWIGTTKIAMVLAGLEDWIWMGKAAWLQARGKV